MRPVRHMRGGGFGGMGGGPMATRLAVAIGGASILVVLAERLGIPGLTGHLLFHPGLVLRGELWQLVTYALFVPLQHPGAIFGFLITLYLLYALGGQIEAVVGSKRLLRFFVGVPAFAAAITTLLYLAIGWPAGTHAGVWVGISSLIILFAHHFAHQSIYLFFVLPVQGRQLIAISFGILALYALIGSPAQVFPEFVGMVTALLYARGGLPQPRRAWLRFRAWRIERELKRRQGRFSVIRGGGQKKRDDERGPWVH